MAEKVPGPPIIDSSLEGLKRWQLERKIFENFYNRGSRYKPFSIEPLPYSVQRTSRKMTDEERFLRKQWVHDQILAPDEPRYVPELRQLNPIRRFYQKPWNAIERALTPVMGSTNAHLVRNCSTRLMMFYGFVLFLYYQSVYNQNTWEKGTGIWLTGQRRVRTGDPNETFPPELKFGDRGFSQREFQNN